jgi:hypothetical protein
MSAIEADKRVPHVANAKELFAHVAEVRELNDGFAFRLNDSPDLLAKLAEFIALERLCCPFFGFTIEVEPEGGAVWLKLTGREGVKPFIQAEIGEFFQEPGLAGKQTTMTKHTLVLLMICLAAFWPSTDATAQKRRAATPSKIEEVRSNGAPTLAPRECLQAFRDFFNYLQKADTNIIRDEAAQKRWLTLELRKALAQKVATFTSPADDPDFPSNGTFIGSWDYPTTYSIATSRRYGRSAVIDVVYKWGPKTNYPGDERTTSFIFMLEEGAWKLDDIYTFRGAFSQAESLNQYLREK